MASTARLIDDEIQTAPVPVHELPLKLPRPLVNRRFAPRLARPFRVRVAGGGPLWRGIDLSFGGMMCAAVEPLWPGNDVEFEILLPGEPHPIPLRGHVVELVSYRGEVAMRVRFEAASRPASKRIATWMAHR